MTDHDQPDFDDPSYADLTALLAGARSTTPVPADVAARLDATLVELTAGRTGVPADRHLTGPLADVVPLRRRSKLAPRLLVAAAAVLAVGAGGVGVTQVLKNNDAGTTATAADSGAVTAESAPQAPADAPTPQAGEVPAAGVNDLSKTLDRLVEVPEFTSAKFDNQVARFTSEQHRRSAVTEFSNQYDADKGLTGAAEGGGTSTRGDAATPARPGASTLNATPGPLASGPGTDLAAGKATCTGPTGTDADIVSILFDGTPAALAVHPLIGGSRLVQAWSCDGTDLLASTTVSH